MGAEAERHVPVREPVEHHLVRAVEHLSSRLPEAHTSSTRSPFAIGQPPTSTSRLAVRASANCGAPTRRNSSTAVRISVGLVDQALPGVAVPVEVEQGAADRRAGGVEPALHA